MITRIEALDFRCLRFISRALSEFHVLVGRNASGKTTFLDVPALLADLVAGVLEGVCRGRSADLRNLVWQRQAGPFEVAIEARIPESKRKGLASEEFDTIRYEGALGFRPDHEEAAILAEKAVLKVSEPVRSIQRSMFPQSQEAPTSILTPRAQRRLWSTRPPKGTTTSMTRRTRGGITRSAWARGGAPCGVSRTTRSSLRQPGSKTCSLPRSRFGPLEEPPEARPRAGRARLDDPDRLSQLEMEPPGGGHRLEVLDPPDRSIERPLLEKAGVTLGFVGSSQRVDEIRVPGIPFVPLPETEDANHELSLLLGPLLATARPRDRGREREPRERIRLQLGERLRRPLSEG